MRFRRKNIRLHPTRYRGRAWFFVTLCCELRQPIFSDSKKAQKLIECLKITAAKCHFAVHAFCVMPDHFHALVEGTAPDSDLLLFVSTFKRATSLEYSGGSGLPLWQKKFYDHVLRPKDSPDAVAWYIWMNPVRKGLCGQPNQYRSSGSFTVQWEKKVQPKDAWVPGWKKDKGCPFTNRTAATKPAPP
jgi:putative transposase